MFFCVVSKIFSMIRFLIRGTRKVYIVGKDGMRRNLSMGRSFGEHSTGEHSIEIKNQQPFVCQNGENCKDIREIIDRGEKICDDRDCLLRGL
jgi:hypothetical protein